jgi:mannose-6-phosphate isomerase class I
VRCAGRSHPVGPTGATIVLCTDGEIQLVDGTTLLLRRGQAAFVPARCDWHLSGRGEAFVATATPVLVHA